MRDTPTDRGRRLLSPCVHSRSLRSPGRLARSIKVGAPSAGCGLWATGITVPSLRPSPRRLVISATRLRADFLAQDHGAIVAFRERRSIGQELLPEEVCRKLSWQSDS
jgi:hypothetical protein